MLKQFSVISTVVFVSACSSFYESSQDYNREFEQGNLDKALKELRSNNAYNRSNTRFLSYVNNGLLLSVMGRYEESNEYLEKAFLFGEDYRINYALEAASYLTNPMVTVYRGEDHEHLMLLYFKALNFLKLGKNEEALVECRRLNIRLQQLSDRYDSPHKYSKDAFIHNLMGIIYQANKDWNNAFIAYRNALQIYENDYRNLFQLETPQQLKIDLLTSAWKTGFKEEFESYREQFSMDDFRVEENDSELVFFWHNGLTPVKYEWSINFWIRQTDNRFIFFNDQYNLNYEFYVDNQDDRNSLSRLEVFRVAFPRYLERPTLYTAAEVKCNGNSFPLELSENVNAIAFTSLQQRMNLEFAKALLRLAMKKATEYSARKEDEGFGAILGVINALTEKADTRNWQTLPHSIYYTRVPLVSGVNKTQFVLTLPNHVKDERNFTYTVKPGETLFHTFTSLEALPTQLR